jgi:hypothetical protein
MSLLRPALLLATLATLAACDDAPADVIVGGTFQRVLDPPPAPITALDLLVVLDTSSSMVAEHAALLSFASTELFDRIAAELGGLPDLHVAVITPDVGASGAPIGACDGDGNDGQFQAGTIDAPCLTGGARYLTASDTGGNYPGTLDEAFACMARTVLFGGCGFEQPFEAVRRALDGRHGDHAGFLRDDALLLVVVLTDEDDCSVDDPAFFASDAAGLGNLDSFRCFRAGVVCTPDDPSSLGAKTGCASREDSAHLQSVGEMAAFLRTLKDDPSQIMVAGMHAPAEPVAVHVDGYAQSPSLAPACASGDGTAAPAIRLAALEDAFPSRAIFGSICDLPMPARLSRIARASGGVMRGGPCLLDAAGVTIGAGTCRGLALPADGTPRVLTTCKDTGATGCVAFETAATCDYTSTSLAAVDRGALRTGERLAVECRID